MSGCEFELGEEITLTATPGSTSTFIGWMGCVPQSDPTCVVTMTETREVSATFEELNEPNEP